MVSSVSSSEIYKISRFSTCNILAIYCFSIFLEKFDFSQVFQPLSNKATLEKYIELIDIIISDIVENHSEYLPFRVTMDSKTTRKII